MVEAIEGIADPIRATRVTAARLASLLRVGFIMAGFIPATDSPDTSVSAALEAPGRISLPPDYARILPPRVDGKSWPGWGGRSHSSGKPARRRPT
jgi:hypothetical protein